jgi:hypothetical protein
MLHKLFGLLNSFVGHFGFYYNLGPLSHYGCPSREVVGLNGQTLLRVHNYGLKIDNKIHEFEPWQGTM